MALQSDGKIIAAGTHFVDFNPGDMSDTDFALARYNPDGSLDSTFGSGGTVTTDFFGTEDDVFAVLIQPDGKIVAVGSANDPADFYDFAAVRYLGNGSTWTVVPSPNPSSTFNYLHGVTAVAANNVWAVGEFNATGGNQRSLFLQWNCSAWVQVAGDNTGPSGVQFFVSAVSALSSSDIWSVGNNSHALAEHWNGASWNLVATPNAGIGDNMLNGVSGTAANDVWEVGYYAFGTWKQTLIEHWNGTRWSIVRSPNTEKRTNILNAVKAISPSDAWAVGSADSGVADQTTLTLHWDGRRWTIVPSPRPGTLGLNVLYGVAANSGNDVWAVGSYTNTGEFAQTLTVHWDGTSWSVIPRRQQRAL